MTPESVADRTDLRELEAALRRHRSVEDCAVLLRRTTAGESLRVAYVVASGTFSAERLAAHLRTSEPELAPPDLYVPVASLPLTPAGRLDETVVKRLEVVDGELARTWEERLRELPGVDRAAVVVREEADEPPPLHLADLVPGWKHSSTAAVAGGDSPAATNDRSASPASDRPAVADGGPPAIVHGAPETLPAALRRAANGPADKGCVHIQRDGTVITRPYAELLGEAECILGGLRKMGLKAGDQVVFQLGRTQDFLAAFWGCVLGGMVPVPVSVPPVYDPANATVAKLRNTWQTLGRPLVLAGADVVPGLRSLATSLELEGFRVEPLDELRTGPADRGWHTPRPDDIAVLLMTSGSTGKPKGVPLSHRNLLTMAAGIIAVGGFTADDVALNWMPLDHVGAVSNLSCMPVYLGCTQVHAQTQTVLEDPLRLLDWIERYRATTSWAPNFAYGLVNDRAAQAAGRRWDLSSMKFLVNGGEAVVAKTARRFLELLAPHGLPGTAMRPAFGMSETASGTSWSEAFTLANTRDDDVFTDVGRPMPGAAYRIVDDDGRVVGEGVVGNLQVKGPSVIAGYYGDAELTRQAFTADGWFRTGDLGFLRHGRLTITGRGKDVIILNGINYYSHEIEAVVEEVPGVEVSYTAACGVRPSGGTAEHLAVFFHTPRTGARLVRLLEEIRGRVVRSVGINPTYLVPLAKAGVPKTEIGKIQRSKLRQWFEAGAFDEVLKRLDVLTANPRQTLPDWFFERVWRRKEPRGPARERPGAVVLFADDTGLAEALVEELDGPVCVLVRFGARFERRGRLTYEMNADRVEDYRQLFDALAGDGLDIGQVVHLWSYREGEETTGPAEAAREAAWFLALTQALATRHASGEPLPVVVVSRHAQAVQPGDMVRPDRAVLPALVRTASLETPFLNCRHVDLGPDRPGADARRVARELSGGGDVEVAFRAGQRFVPRLAKADWRASAGRADAFENGGRYVITGGLGDIGIQIAKYLLTRYQARLVVVGRTPLAAEDGGSDKDRTGKRLEALRELQALGDVAYEGVDVSDAAALKRAVGRARERWGGAPYGVIHLAGTTHYRLLAEESTESFAEILRPKLGGALALEEVLADQPDPLFVLFSSTTSLTGGAMVGAYAAANRALEAFAHRRRAEGLGRTYCFSWSMWDEVGMSQGYQGKELLRGQGLHLLSKEQGIHSLLAGLGRGDGQLVIGLDPAALPVRRQLEPVAPAIRSLRGFVTLRPAPGEAPIEPAAVRDRFGTPSRCQVTVLDEMPLDASGAIDREELAAPSERGRGGRREPAAPRDEVEGRIAAVWREVLEAPAVGVHDNFFELGGHSLLATQVVSRLSQATGREVPLRLLFENPTVAKLRQALAAAPSSGGPGRAVLRPAVHNGELPLSFAQQRIWFIDQLAPGKSTYNLPAAFRLRGPLDLRALEQALEQINRRHESLRTCFPSAAGKPVQAVAPPGLFALDVVDFGGLTDAEREDRALAFVRAEADRPFDLAHGPLFRAHLVRLSNEDHALLLNVHHIVSDAWSLGVLTGELSALYEAFRAGRPSPLPELPIQYADFAVWQRDQVQGEKLDALLGYWKSRLEGVPTLLELPSDRPRPPVQTHRSARLPFTLPKELSEGVVGFSQRQGATLFMTLMAAFQGVLYRYSGQERFIVSTGTGKRDLPETESLIGCLINVLLLRADLSGNPRFVELLDRVREDTLGAFAHQDLPFEKLAEALQPTRDPSYNPLTQVMLVLLNAPMYPPRLAGLDVSAVRTEVRANEYDLVMHVYETAEGLAGYLDYSTDLYHRSTVERLVGHFQRFLEGVLADPRQRVARMPLLTDAERRQILYDWNDTRWDFPRDTCLHELFERQVARDPQATAVLFGEKAVSYGDIERRANQLAHYLRRLGVRPDVLVGLSVERSVEMVVGILGIMKAGGAYVPLDPAYPQDRLRFMIEDTRAPVLLTQERLVPALGDVPARVVRLDADWATIAEEPADKPDVDVGPLNLSYVIFTSGSTGVPKGIAVQHRGVVNNILDLNGRFGVGPRDRILALSSLSFDMCVYEVFGTLDAGAAIVMPLQEELREPARWAELIRRHRVTVWNSAPALLKMLVDYVADRPELWPRALHLAILGGDWVPVTLPDRLKAMAPNVRFVPLGGATEASIHSIIYPVDRVDPRWKSIPYGKPQYNQKAYILNPYLEPAPVGVAGELYLGGTGLGRGYFRRPDQTAERFLPNPFPAESGERIYKTGDLARYWPDGTIELIGRIDYQVKLRGLRIECGEIEAAIRRHPGVREAVVVAQGAGAADKRLVAFVRPKSAGIVRAGSNGTNGEVHGGGDEADSSHAEVLIGELREAVRCRLPDYMVPAAFILVPELPLSPNGKVDRKALAAREVTVAPRAEGAFTPPRSADEETLATIFARVLGVERVGREDNFFELGGHSLLATQVVSQVRDAFRVDLPLRSLFDAPSVAAFAEQVRTACLDGDADRGPSIPRAGRDGPLPLSFAQQRFWFLDQLLPGSASYNIPFAFHLTGPLDLPALERSLREVVRRHEALRTSFPSVDGQPVQHVGSADDFSLPVIDLCGRPESDRRAEALHLADQEARRGFDFERGPLFRCTLVRLAGEEHMLLVTMHHAGSDGRSLEILTQELSALYEAFANGRPSPLAAPPVQYADYAVWERAYLQGSVLEGHVGYWKHQLAGAPPKLELPTDRPRPAVQTLRGARHFFELPAALARDVEVLGRAEGATTFMALLAAFDAFLYAYTGQDDVLVGSPFANRTRRETENLIGSFVNTVVLRMRLDGRPAYRELLGRSREVVLGADAHQDLPFERVVEIVRPPRDPSRNPLFQVNFRVVVGPVLSLRLPGLQAQLRMGECAHSKFDLALELLVEPDRFGGFFEYSTDLFEAASVVRMVGEFETLVKDLLGQPDRAVEDLDGWKAIRQRVSGRQGAAPERPKMALREMRRRAVDLP